MVLDNFEQYKTAPAYYSCLSSCLTFTDGVRFNLLATKVLQEYTLGLTSSLGLSPRSNNLSAFTLLDCSFNAELCLLLPRLPEVIRVLYAVLLHEDPHPLDWTYSVALFSFQYFLLSKCRRYLYYRSNINLTCATECRIWSRPWQAILNNPWAVKTYWSIWSEMSEYGAATSAQIKDSTNSGLKSSAACSYR